MWATQVDLSKSELHFKPMWGFIIYKATYMIISGSGQANTALRGDQPAWSTLSLGSFQNHVVVGVCFSHWTDAFANVYLREVGFGILYSLKSNSSILLF